MFGPCLAGVFLSLCLCTMLRCHTPVWVLICFNVNPFVCLCEPSILIDAPPFNQTSNTNTAVANCFPLMCYAGTRVILLLLNPITIAGFNGFIHEDMNQFHQIM